MKCGKYYSSFDELHRWCIALWYGAVTYATISPINIIDIILNLWYNKEEYGNGGAKMDIAAKDGEKDVPVELK